MKIMFVTLLSMLSCATTHPELTAASTKSVDVQFPVTAQKSPAPQPAANPLIDCQSNGTTKVCIDLNHIETEDDGRLGVRALFEGPQGDMAAVLVFNCAAGTVQMVVPTGDGQAMEFPESAPKPNSPAAHFLGVVCSSMGH